MNGGGGGWVQSAVDRGVKNRQTLGHKIVTKKNGGRSNVRNWREESVPSEVALIDETPPLFLFVVSLDSFL